MSERNALIDSLRGIAILLMILIHVTVFFPKDTIALTLWNWSQFAVPVFIFCSSYLFIQKYMTHGIGLFTYFKKRLSRLVIPYYLFLLFFLPLLFFITPEKITSSYLIESLFVIGGVEINWLVLLFIMLAVLFPFFSWSFQKKRIFYWGFFVLSLGSACLFTFWQPSFSYKWIMWLPWSLLFYFAHWYQNYGSEKKYLINAFLFFFFVVCLFFSGEPMIWRENKYPPNIVYLFFGMASILFLSFWVKYIKIPLLRKIIHFFSIYSYPLYFIHYFVLTVIASFLPIAQWGWFVMFFVVLMVTVCIQWYCNKMLNILK